MNFNFDFEGPSSPQSAAVYFEESYAKMSDGQKGTKHSLDELDNDHHQSKKKKKKEDDDNNSNGVPAVIPVNSQTAFSIFSTPIRMAVNQHFREEVEKRQEIISLINVDDNPWQHKILFNNPLLTNYLPHFIVNVGFGSQNSHQILQSPFLKIKSKYFYNCVFQNLQINNEFEDCQFVNCFFNLVSFVGGSSTSMSINTIYKNMHFKNCRFNQVNFEKINLVNGLFFHTNFVDPLCCSANNNTNDIFEQMRIVCFNGCFLENTQFDSVLFNDHIVFNDGKMSDVLFQKCSSIGGGGESGNAAIRFLNVKNIESTTIYRCSFHSHLIFQRCFIDRINIKFTKISTKLILEEIIINEFSVKYGRVGFLEILGQIQRRRRSVVAGGQPVVMPLQDLFYETPIDNVYIM